MIGNLFDKLPTPLQVVAFLMLLAIGTFSLIKCCNIFLDSSITIAKKFNIPSIIIGMTIVAIGTSIPEFAVSVADAISSSINGVNSNIGFSNVVGSNISNLLLVLSFSCLFSPLIIKKENKTEYKIMIVVSIIFTLLSLFFSNGSFFKEKAILRWEALLLVIIAFVYCNYLVRSNKNKEENKEENNEDTNIFKISILIILSIVGIALGGEAIVIGAKGIALKAATAMSIDKNVAENLVGLTIVAVGTSLPELVTTIVASKKGENDLALGNIIGSNLFNIILVIGISGLISPFTINNYMIIDVLFMLFATLIVWMFIRKGKLTRNHSYLLLSMYLVYVIYLIIRTI